MSNEPGLHDDGDSGVGGPVVSEQTSSKEGPILTQQVFDAVEGRAVVSIGEGKFILSSPLSCTDKSPSAGPSSTRRRNAKRVRVRGQSSQKEGRGQKRKRVDLANDAECLPPGSSKRVWTKMVARPSTVASKEGPSTEEETRPDCPDDSERTILRTGKSSL